MKPFEQEFVLAESQSMSGSGYTGTLDELVNNNNTNGERQVIVATWKLARRAQDAAGPRSEQDIRTVGRTQADLKARVEQTASSFRESTLRDPGRRAPATPSASQTRPEEDAMTAAAEAMGKAAASLDALSTSEALSPEMRALNDLLKAQADVKRRQLSLDQSAAPARPATTTATTTSRRCSTVSCGASSKPATRPPEAARRKQAPARSTPSRSWRAGRTSCSGVSRTWPGRRCHRKS